MGSLEEEEALGVGSGESAAEVSSSGSTSGVPSTTSVGAVASEDWDSPLLSPSSSSSGASRYSPGCHVRSQATRRAIASSRGGKRPRSPGPRRVHQAEPVDRPATSPFVDRLLVQPNASPGFLMSQVWLGVNEERKLGTPNQCVRSVVAAGARSSFGEILFREVRPMGGPQSRHGCHSLGLQGIESRSTTFCPGA